MYFLSLVLIHLCRVRGVTASRGIIVKFYGPRSLDFYCRHDGAVPVPWHMQVWGAGTNRCFIQLHGYYSLSVSRYTSEQLVSQAKKVLAGQSR